MNKAKDSIIQAVEAEIISDTAVAIRSDVSKISQDVMKDEIHASHLQNIGMMAIENVIDEDKSALEEQLNEVRLRMDKATEALTKAEKGVEAEINRFKKQIISKELRRKQSDVVRVLSKLSDLEDPVKVGGEGEDPDSNLELKYIGPSEDGEDALARAGYIKWSFYVTQKTRTYGSPNGLRFSGKRAIDQKCMDALKAVGEVRKVILSLQNVNREIRIQIQGLEKDRRDMQRTLRQEIVSRSVVGNEIEKMIKKRLKRVKLLALPEVTK